MVAVVTEASVEAAGEELVVRWRLAGGETAVDVAIGPTPELVDHVHAVTVLPGTHEVRIPRPTHCRPYLSVGPQGGGALVVAERRVPFAAVTNFRDLGGYPTTGGGRTKWGRVFRSDALHRLTPAERSAYERLDLRAVYDLRGDVERERYPNPVASAHHLPLLAALDGAAAAGPPPPAPQDAADGERRLRDLYLGLLAHAGPLFGRLFEGLAAPGGLPAVFHCTGGKDRTGVAAALLLDLLDVPREQVLDDYALTSLFRRREHQTESYETMVQSGLPAEAAAAVLGAPRWAMAEALAHLDEAYGGARHYLLAKGRLATGVLDALESALVE